MNALKMRWFLAGLWICGIVGPAGPASASGPVQAPVLKDLYYLPEYDLLTFSVDPELPRTAGASLAVFPLQGDRPLHELPVKALPAIEGPAVVQVGRETGLRTISRVRTVSPRGQRVETRAIQAVGLETVPAGRYRLKLVVDGPRANDLSYSTFEVPARQAILSVRFREARPVDLEVGDFFDVEMVVENTGPASARDVELTLTARNQQFQSVDPKMPVREQGDRVRLAIAEVPARAKLPIKVRYRAAAAEPRPRLDLEFDAPNLVHPAQRAKRPSLAIGKVSPR